MSSRAASVDRVAELGDAYVEVDHDSARWTIGNDLVTYVIRVSAEGALSADGLRLGPSDDVVTRGRESDSLATLDGVTARLGAPDTAFVVADVRPSAGSHFVALSVQLKSPDHLLLATRHYVVYPRTAAVEMWTEFATADRETRSIGTLNAFALTVPGGQIDWVSGLDTPPDEGGPFTKRTRFLTDGERLDLGSPTQSSETTVPYVSIGNGHRRFYAGLIWSGAWSATLEHRAGGLQVTMGLPHMSARATPSRSVEGPHAFVGAVLDRPGADTAAVMQFVRAGRAGREFPALTTFNTWFVHGVGIDERRLQVDIDFSSLIGIEQLQVDAGWYRREEPAGVFDFTNGLGSWEVDAERFPNGLGALGDYARERGVKLGVWVEPERVALSTVGLEGLAAERFLAMQSGEYHPGVANEDARDAQICLADAGARQWLLHRLTQFIDEVRPDNLKWDFNRWVTCTREGHGHPIDGGNYEHTRGLYELLAALRERYPALTIENCSQGGHRMDFAMARLTDTAWMDDRTAPAAHVRRNLHGLMSMFPPEYLFSYVMPHADEPLRGAGDIPMLVRSRMPGVIGLAAELHLLTEGELNQLNQQIELAKQLRPLQKNAMTYTLTPQGREYGEWEVIQQALPDGGSVIFAFSNGARDPVQVFLRGIRPDVTYELRSSDRGRLGRLRGIDLMISGLEIEEAPESLAQVLVLSPTTGLGVDAPR